MMIARDRRRRCSTRRRDRLRAEAAEPVARHFGFHEIFHVCTVLAFLCHWTACLLIAMNPLRRRSASPRLIASARGAFSSRARCLVVDVGRLDGCRLPAARPRALRGSRRARDRGGCGASCPSTSSDDRDHEEDDHHEAPGPGGDEVGVDRRRRASGSACRGERERGRARRAWSRRSVSRAGADSAGAHSLESPA